MADRPGKGPGLDDIRQTIFSFVLVPKHSQTVRTFGLNQEAVVKKKFFEYGVDKRLSC